MEKKEPYISPSSFDHFTGQLGGCVMIYEKTKQKNPIPNEYKPLQIDIKLTATNDLTQPRGLIGH